ncbi:MAG: DMT family transporter [Pseudomonadota bacterium]
MPSNPRMMGYLFALLATIFWSGNFLVSRAVAESFSPIMTTYLRWLVALAVTLPFGWKYLRADWPIIRQHFNYFALLSIIGVSLMQICIYIAGQTTAVLNMSLIASSSPIWIVLSARILLGDTINARQVVGMCIAILGTLLLLTHGDLTLLYHLTFTIGDLWVLASSLLFGIYSALLRKKPDGVSGLGLLVCTFVMGFAVLTPFALWAVYSGTLMHFTVQSITGILYIGIFASCLAFITWNKAVEIIGPSQSALVYYSIPFFSAFEGYALLGEQIRFEQIGSGILILTGSIIAMKRQ